MLQIIATDFEIRIIKRTETLVLGGSEFEMIPRKEGTGIKEHLSAKGMFAHIEAETTNRIHGYPLLAPFDFMTVIAKLHRRVFLDEDILSNIEYFGRSKGDLEMHIGDAQLIFLNDLLGILLRFLDHMEASGGMLGDDEAEGPRQPSMLQLQFPSFTLKIENEVSITLLRTCFYLTLDQSIKLLECRGGVVVGDFPVMTVSGQCSCCIDFVSNKFGFQREGDDIEVVNFLNASQTEVEVLGRYVDFVTGIFPSLEEVGGIGYLSERSNKEIWTADIRDLVKLSFEGSEIIEIVVQGIRLEIGDTMEAVIEKIEMLNVVGMFQLYRSINFTTVSFNGNKLSILLNELHCVLCDNMKGMTEESMQHAKIFEKSGEILTDDDPGSVFDAVEARGLELPFVVEVSMTQLTALKRSKPNKVFCVADNLLCVFSPGSTASYYITTEISLKEFKHAMIRIDRPKLSMLVDTRELETLRQADFCADRIEIVTGYSSKQWFGLIGRRQSDKSPRKGKVPHKPLNLPHAHVQPLKIVATVDGVVGMKETSFFLGEFSGRPTTTTDDLIKFYSARVAAKVPGIVTSSEILGVDVADTFVGLQGAIHTHSILVPVIGGLGGVAGGVLTVAAFDGIKNTLRAGKMSRGAEIDDQWKFSDFRRGLKFAARNAAKAGAAKRGKEGNGNLVDWTVGAAADVRGYAAENKSRLGTVGAGTVGFVVGGVFGPLGSLTGGILASALTGQTLNRIGHDRISTLRDATDDSSHPHEGVELEIEGHEIKPLLGTLSLRKTYFLYMSWQSHLFLLMQTDDRNELRYFCLEGILPSERNVVSYYLDGTHKPKKKMNLKGAKAMKNDGLTVPGKGALFVFEIHWADKDEAPWILGAPTTNDRARWVERLNSNR